MCNIVATLQEVTGASTLHSLFIKKEKRASHERVLTHTHRLEMLHSEGYSCTAEKSARGLNPLWSEPIAIANPKLERDY